MISEFALKVRNTILKHRMLDAHDRILVGVSGGADSVALLLVLRELGYFVGVAHLNHGLRGEAAAEDARFVAALAERLQVPYFSRELNLSGDAGNIEAAGRAARIEFFRNVMKDASFSRLALAHHRQDRVETFLFHLVRGSGTEGLVSMAPVSGTTVRPLIDVERSAIEDYLLSRGQPWQTDHTNFDIDLSRNRMRHVVLPELATSFNPKVVESVARTADLLRDEDQWMRGMAEDWLTEHARFVESEVRFSASALHSSPVPLVRRVLREALRRTGSTLHDVTFEHIEQIRTILEPGKSGKMVQIPGEIVALREFDTLTIRPPLEPPGNFDYELQIPGAVHIHELGTMFRAEVIEPQDIAEGRGRVFVDGGRLGAYVRIRTWKSGDYYRPLGLPAGKLKKLFQRARIPRSQRSSWPVFVTDSAVVWVASFPVSREFAPCGSSQKIVAFEAIPD